MKKNKILLGYFFYLYNLVKLNLQGIVRESSQHENPIPLQLMCFRLELSNALMSTNSPNDCEEGMVRQSSLLTGTSCADIREVWR